MSQPEPIIVYYRLVARNNFKKVLYLDEVNTHKRNNKYFVCHRISDEIIKLTNRLTRELYIDLTENKFLDERLSHIEIDEKFLKKIKSVGFFI